jgi:outer membrane protein insertion porin family
MSLSPIARRGFVAGLLTLCAGPLQAAEKTIIGEIQFIGNHALSRHQLLETLDSRQSEALTPSRFSVDLQHILESYHRIGYYLAEVDAPTLRFSRDSSEVAITYSVREGACTPVADIVIEGNSARSTGDILDQFETRIGGILDPVVLEKDIQGVISRYERLGYPFTTVEVKDIELPQDSQGLRVRLAVDEGAKVTIDEIRIRGNRETSDRVIVRETRITPSELYDEDKVSRIPRRLTRLNIFSRVSSPEVYLTGQGGGLLITLEEGSTNTFDGLVGYVPDSPGGSGGYVTGMVNVVMRNLFGTARMLDVHWLREDLHSQEIGVAYHEPWLLELPLNVSGTFFQRQQDTIYVRRTVGFNVDLMISEALSLGGSVSQENVIPSSTIATAAVSNSRILTAGLEIHFDSRDDIVSPTTGVDYRTDYQIGAKKIFGVPVAGTRDRSTVQKISLDAEVFLEPVERQVVALGVHGRQIASESIELSDRFRFGGTNTLRGFRENQFLGSRIAWTRSEYRLLLARRSYFYGFFDTGYYFLPADDQNGIPSSQNFKYGYGIGIRLETVVGNVGVSVALGGGDSFNQAKLHFGLVNDF